MLGFRETDEVLGSVVGSDTVEVMHLMAFRDGMTALCRIDGMRNEDVFVMSKCISEMQIALFASGIVLYLAVRSRFERRINELAASVENAVPACFFFRSTGFDPEGHVERVWYGKETMSHQPYA